MGNEETTNPTPGTGAAGPDLVEWTAVLAKWTAYARATAVLPRKGPGAAWRASVPAVIGLQAITLALREVGGWPRGPARRAARAVAGATVERYEGELRRLFDPLPEGIVELIDDARSELARTA